MNYQTRLLALLNATVLRQLTNEQDDLITWAAGALDPDTVDALARLFRSIRVDAFRFATRGAA